MSSGRGSWGHQNLTRRSMLSMTEQEHWSPGSDRDWPPRHDHQHRQAEEGSKKNPGESRQSRSGGRWQCYRCQGFGHIARNCPQAAVAPGRRQDNNDQGQRQGQCQNSENVSTVQGNSHPLIPNEVSDRELEQVLAQRRFQWEQHAGVIWVWVAQPAWFGLKFPETKPSDPMSLWIFMLKVLQYDFKLSDYLCYTLLGRQTSPSAASTIGETLREGLSRWWASTGCHCRDWFHTGVGQKMCVCLCLCSLRAPRQASCVVSTLSWPKRWGLKYQTAHTKPKVSSSDMPSWTSRDLEA